MPKGMDELLNPVGMVGSNPNKDSPCLEIEFERFANLVTFPSMQQIEEYAQFVTKLERDSLTSLNKVIIWFIILSGRILQNRRK